MSRNIVKNISKNLACNYSQGISDHAKKSVIDAPKTALKIGIQKIAEAVGDLIGKVSRSSPQNREIVKQRDLSPEKR